MFLRGIWTFTFPLHSEEVEEGVDCSTLIDGFLDGFFVGLALEEVLGGVRLAIDVVWWGDAGGERHGAGLWIGVRRGRARGELRRA